MLFTSYEFVLFLLCVCTVYYVMPAGLQWMWLLGASYIFYYMANPVWLSYIIVLTAIIWIAAKSVEGKKNRKILVVALLCVIGGLWVIKYTDIWENKFGIMIPLGISFYTIQALGYLFDVYRKKYPAEKNIARLGLFLGFFPQLVQGPISRYDQVAPTMFTVHKWEWHNISFGAQRMLWGYFKKLVIADRIAPAVKMIISNPDVYDGGYVFVGMAFYAVQLYADFTGGIDIVLGIGQMLGVTLPENFRQPYFSKSVKEYWTRWHITMGSWFRDYVFYPISVCSPLLKFGKWSRQHWGNGFGKRLPVYVASFIVWATTGVWHGTGWNFLVWGIGNFVIIMISQELAPVYRRFHQRYEIAGTKWFQGFQIIRTIFIMSCLRTLDCYGDVGLAFRMLGSMFCDVGFSKVTIEGIGHFGLDMTDYVILGIGIIVMLMVSIFREKESVREHICRFHPAVRFIIWYGLFLTVLMFGAYGIGYEESQFVYHQMVS